MSGRAAKATRRAERERLDEALRQAHDQLHRDDVDAAHEVIHEALGQGDAVMRVAPLAGMAGFDLAFRRLCEHHGVQAAYVAVDAAHRREDGASRLVSGGDGALCRTVDDAMRRYIAEAAR